MQIKPDSPQLKSTQLPQDWISMLGAIFANTSNLVAVFVPAGDIVYANAAFNSVFKRDHRNAALTLTDTNAQTFFSQAISQVVKTQSAHVSTLVADEKLSDLAAQMLVEFSPICNQANEPIGILAIACPQSAQTVMQEEPQYLRAMLDALPFIVWLKDQQSHFLTTNIKFAEVAGVNSHVALKSKTDFDFFPQELAQNYVNDDQEVLATGQPKITVEKIQGSGSQSYWAETYKAPVLIDGRLIGTVGYARDMTEQNALLSRIEKKELEYISLVKSIPISIIRYDLAGRRVFANASERDFLGEDMDSLLGKTPLELWNPNIINMSGEQFHARLMEVMQQGNSQRFELHCQTREAQFFNMVTLVPEYNNKHVVVGALMLSSDITEISHYRHSLEHLAYHDALTQLPNRTLLNKRLEAAIKYANEHQHGFGLLFVDLDYFKSINDTLGHSVGDQLLVKVAQKILASLRVNDLVARIGGDEFAIVVADVNNNEDLGILAAKIADTLAEPFNIEGVSFFITASIGIACYPADSDNIDDLLKYADTAMYQAKKQGRNNFQFYTPDLTQHVVEHLAIATALRYAIGKQELLLHYQPLVDIETGRILGAEALLRWHGKVLGVIQPDKFIPIAEESGLINEIGGWALQQACRAAVLLNQARSTRFVVAVNLSSRQFAGQNFVAFLTQCLADSGCDPTWLTLEITESLLLHDNDPILQTLNKIDAMGVSVAIDDFGTGYSALAYLNKFPIRQVKIDRSFVLDISTNPRAASLVKAIVAMAISLDKDLVAEGIETQEQARLIQSFGCHQAQGYLYSKPMPLAELMTRINH